MREICTSGSEGGWGGKPPWSTRPPKRRPEPSPPRRVKVSASSRQGLQPSWLAQGCYLDGVAQGGYLGGARAEARGRRPFGRTQRDPKGPGN